MTAISDEHHIVRYVRPGLIDEGVIDGHAFVRRKLQGGQVEDCPSVSWVEAFAGSLQERITSVLEHTRMGMSANGCLCRLNVGRSRNAVASSGLAPNFDVHGDPLPAAPPQYPLDDPAHALLEGLPHPDAADAEAVGDILKQTEIDRFAAR